MVLWIDRHFRIVNSEFASSAVFALQSDRIRSDVHLREEEHYSLVRVKVVLTGPVVKLDLAA